MTKKNKSNDSHPISNDSPATTPPPAAPIASTQGNAPPAMHAPAPPDGWKPTKRARFGLRPKLAQTDGATSVAKELEQSSTYVDDFGAKAPKPGVLASSLKTAAAWRDEWAAAKRWFEYVSEQRAIWENEMLVQMDALQPAFEYGCARDSELAKRYPSLKQFFGVTALIGQRISRVRKNEKAKKAKAAPTAPAQPAPPSELH